eukprot:COSAG02_NODE_1094_length_14603_cov_40.760549_11_plen_932_part_00
MLQCQDGAHSTTCTRQSTTRVVLLLLRLSIETATLRAVPMVQQPQLHDKVVMEPPGLSLLNVSVVLPAIPNCIERLAAQELRREIAMITVGDMAALPPLLFEPVMSQGVTFSPRLFVGNTTRSAVAGVRVRQFLAEEAVVATVGNDMYVFGDDSGSPVAASACRSALGSGIPACVGAMAASTQSGCRGGTFYAAVTLLREVLGVRWIWPGEDGVVRPKPSRTLTIANNVFIRTVPGIALRRIRPDPASGIPHELTQALGPTWHGVAEAVERSAEEDAMWMLRNGLGGQHVVPWGQAFMGAWEKYGATHPTWFALHEDGFRGCQKMTDCMNHAQYVKVDPSSDGMAKHVAGGFVDSGQIGVSACEDDYDAGYCTCAKCRKLDPPERAHSPHGRLSDRYTYFWNAVHRALRKAGHPEGWVGAYAYASYTDPPLRQRFDNESKVLVLSVGFGSAVEDNSSTESRAGWAGWLAAGAKGLALRPNSLWSEYSGLPFVFSEQWLDDIEWCGQNAMHAADFDSLLGDWAAVGPSYYALARTLWDPARANRTAIMSEYYSGFGQASKYMQTYHSFWRKFAQRVYTNPAVLARIAEYDHNLGAERAQFIMAGSLYSKAVLGQASALLTQAESYCGVISEAACVRVAKSRAHLAYTDAMATAANATTPSAGIYRRTVSHLTVPAGEMIAAGRALHAIAQAIAGQHVVNTYLGLGKANERGDLLGLLATGDAPVSQLPDYMLSPLFWFMALDPSDIGLKDKWFRPTYPHTSVWNRSAVGCFDMNWCGRCGSLAEDEWERTNGLPYQGVSWWALHDIDTCTDNKTDCSSPPLFGDNTTSKLYLKDGRNASSIKFWVNGHYIGGCMTSSECSREVILPFPADGTAWRLGPGSSALVARINSTNAPMGTLRRVFVLKSCDLDATVLSPAALRVDVFRNGQHGFNR